MFTQDEAPRMGRAIQKYVINPHIRTDWDMPRGAKVLGVQLHRGRPYMWVMVNTEETQMERRRFMVVGTGHPIPDEAVYIGTWQGSPMVWHLFEVV